MVERYNNMTTFLPARTPSYSDRILVELQLKNTQLFILHKLLQPNLWHFSTVLPLGIVFVSVRYFQVIYYGMLIEILSSLFSIHSTASNVQARFIGHSKPVLNPNFGKGCSPCFHRLQTNKPIFPIKSMPPKSFRWHLFGLLCPSTWWFPPQKYDWDWTLFTSPTCIVFFLYFVTLYNQTSWRCLNKIWPGMLQRKNVHSITSFQPSNSFFFINISLGHKGPKRLFRKAGQKRPCPESPPPQLY